MNHAALEYRGLRVIRGNPEYQEGPRANQLVAVMKGVIMISLSHVIGIISGIAVGAAFVANASSQKCHLYVEQGVDGRAEALNIEGEPGTRFIVGKE